MTRCPVSYTHLPVGDVAGGRRYLEDEMIRFPPSPRDHYSESIKRCWAAVSYTHLFLEEPYEKTPEHDALIAKIDACNKADAEAQADPHFFDEFLEKWDRGEYHD